MGLFRRVFGRDLAPRPAAATRRHTRKRLQFEPLEHRELLTTVPFTIVNNTVGATAGTLNFQDNQINIAIYGQDFSNADDYYYFDASGNAHLTSTVAPNAQNQKLVPTFTLNALKQTGDHTYEIDLPEVLTDNQGINSARVYISMNAPLTLTINSDSKGSVNAPTFDDSFFDFFEFTLNKAQTPAQPPSNLNIDTTNVDQFGFPITIKLDSTDTIDNPVDGVGTATTRASVISQFQSFTADPGDPFAICLWPTSDGDLGPYRILNPSDVLDDVQPAINQVWVKTTVMKQIEPTDTQIEVFSGTSFPDPSTGFLIQIDNEQMHVTGTTAGPSGTTLWTVKHTQNGTTAAVHTAGTVVTVPTNDPAMSATQTTFTIAGTVNFPTPSAADPFFIRIDSEIIKVTGVVSKNADGTQTWQIVRGQDGTTAATHNEDALVYYNSVTSLGLNSYFDGAIDALFTKYLNATGSNQLVVEKTINSVQEVLQGSVVLVNGDYVLRFKNEDTTDTTNYDVYYPFFKDNAYLYLGYTPALTPGDAPNDELDADIASFSPSSMVFNCNGVFADNTQRADQYNAAQQTLLAALEDEVVSALNRGVAQLPGYSALSSAGTWEDTTQYYKDNGTGQVWNRYAQFLHQDTVSINGLNYGFAFDDQAGQASDIGVTSFTNATITLAPWGVGSPVPPNPPNPPGPPDPLGGISIRKFVIPTLPPEGTGPSGSAPSNSPPTAPSTPVPPVSTTPVTTAPVTPPVSSTPSATHTVSLRSLLSTGVVTTTATQPAAATATPAATPAAVPAAIPAAVPAAVAAPPPAAKPAVAIVQAVVVAPAAVPKAPVAAPPPAPAPVVPTATASLRSLMSSRRYI